MTYLDTQQEYLSQLADTLAMPLSGKLQRHFIQAANKKAKLRHDSRKTQTGDILVALDGQKHKASQYLSPASVQRKAGLILVDSSQAIQIKQSVSKAHQHKLLFVEQLAKKVSALAAAFYRHPSKDMKLIAITGSNGKTSLAFLFEHFYKQSGHATGIISTILQRSTTSKEGSLTQISKNTTPHAIDLHTSLASMRDLGVETVILEASSEGLALGRLSSIHLDSALLTNLSSDHLDFHKNMQQYFLSKFKLFSLLKQSEKKNKQALISLRTLHNSWALSKLGKLATPTKNLQSFWLESTLPYSALLKNELKQIFLPQDAEEAAKVFRKNLSSHQLYSFKLELQNFMPRPLSVSADTFNASASAKNLAASPTQSWLRLFKNNADTLNSAKPVFPQLFPELFIQLTTPLLGQMNGENIALVLLEILTSAKFSQISHKERSNLLEQCKQSLATFSIPGRMQWVQTHSPCVIIDFAHSPGALYETLVALQSLKKFPLFRKAKLHTLFGCGGDRDALKRPLMGAIAYALSDGVFLSSDNPRSEDPKKILDEIEAGILGKKAELRALSKSSTINFTEKPYVTIVNREQAIFKAIHSISLNDILLVAGKGHEQYQETASGKKDFDEKEILNMALKSRKA